MEPVQAKHSTKSSRLVILVVLIVVVLALVVVVGLIKPRTDGNPGIDSLNGGISSNALSLTAPLTNVTGVITSLNGNSFNLSIQGSDKSQLSGKNIAYQVNIASNASISRQGIFIPGVSSRNSQNFSASDLKAGQIVNVTSKTDLRTAGSSFEATAIEVEQPTFSINGRLMVISGNNLSIQSYGSSDRPEINPNVNPSGKSYTVTTNSSTQFYSTNSPAGKLTPGSLEALKSGDNLFVYTSTDPTSTNSLAAIAVEVIPLK